MPPAPAISFDGVTFGFPGKPLLFHGLNLDLEAGGFYLIQGPSGVGKSTLLRLVCRFEEPLEGVIRLQGRPIGELYPPSLRRRVLYIQQTPTVMDASVRENLLLGFAFRNNADMEKPGDPALREALDGFMLDGVDLDDAASNLSVGQQQRLCLIRGMLLDPETVLLDEPTSALDPQSARLVEGMAERLCRERGLTVVMITHREFEPQSVPFKRVVLNGGLTVEG